VSQARRLHVIVRGRVQGVGFRYFVDDQARALGLSGWVRNLDDGSTVEAVAEGPEDRLRDFEARLRHGPRFARVESLESTWSDQPEDHAGFELRW
jgi:acylphosphatase